MDSCVSMPNGKSLLRALHSLWILETCAAFACVRVLVSNTRNGNLINVIITNTSVTDFLFHTLISLETHAFRFSTPEI